MSDKKDKALQRSIDCLESLQNHAYEIGVGEGLDALLIDLREALEQPAPAVPHGWKLVPLEPTEQMAEAAENVCIGTDADWREEYITSYGAVEVYRAMLSAAPQAPAVQPLTDERIFDIAKVDCKLEFSNDDDILEDQQIESVIALSRAVIAEFCRINGIGAPKGNV